MEEGNNSTTNYYHELPESAPSPKPARAPAPAPAPVTIATKTTVHVTALDSIVNVNALFTIAVFIGLSLSAPSPDQSSTSQTSSCLSQNSDVRKLLVYEVISFSFFLCSSLIAQGLKLAINLLNSKVLEVSNKAEINCTVLNIGMLGSAIGSVMGCVFLMLSMVMVVEVKLGKLSCGGDTLWAVLTLLILVTSALFVYISTVVYAFLDL